MNRERKAQLLQGNQACSLAAIDAGVRFYAGYPITPSTEIAEFMAEHLPRIGGKFIQMEDELGGMGAVLGAALTGAKVITATSGPGFSLKQENIGFAAMAEIPCVIVNVQRMGPSTGGPTSPAQGDIMQARWGTHGDHPIIALSPASVLETYELTVKAVNFAEKFRVPVIILLDEVVGHMREKVVLPDPAELEVVDRKRPAVLPGSYRPYETDDTGIPAMADFGTGYRWHVTGLTHNEEGAPTGQADSVERQLTRLFTKLDRYEEEITLYKTFKTADASCLFITFGCTARSAAEAVNILREEGLKAGLLQLQTIWPFPRKVVKELTRDKELVFVPELNWGQLRGEVEKYAPGKEKLYGINKINGELITPQEIAARVKEVAKAC
ncbi:MAG: 2-oxoacid:acceptor oxidoreductase subunit alpha [Peptococcaceae bacterium]|nr:2-oxoacid:acceptor oxidoreductase subunit alpha [Peptococcaceae bacterium]MDH7525942.1 2-oxoacid:acceptor oxidoreductase subunit alpha [Peptococcaceae bacterium]